MPDQPPPNFRRNRFRLSVQRLIILVLVIGNWLGWLARSARRQREAVAAIQRDGGWVNYDWQRRGDKPHRGSVSASNATENGP
jgi:hypothetical protein